MTSDEQAGGPGTRPGFRVDQAFVGHAALKDGTPVVLRLVRPDDAPLLLAGFEQLSPLSRYRRFLGAKTRLTERDLAYLTDVDQISHVAVGAQLDTPGKPAGLGIARYVRMPGDPEVAEAAVAVVDAYQDRGLGRILLRLLVAAAQERGIKRFRSTVLAANDPIRNLILEAVPQTEITSDVDGELRVDVPIPEELVDLGDLTRPVGPVPLRQLLALAAQGVARVLLDTLGLRSDPE